MELIERIPLRPIIFLSNIKFDAFKQDCIDNAVLLKEPKPKDSDIKGWYSSLQSFCNCNIKTKGVTKRIYSYSSTTPTGLGGRLFCGGSVQGLWGKYRGLIMRDITTDIDMCNAHPVILRYICKKHDIDCPCLEYYINNRDECLSKFENRNIGKTKYLIATNKDKYSRDSSLPTTFKNYDKEMKKIQKQLIELPEYKELFDNIPEQKALANYNGCAINRILCYYENIILQHAIHILNYNAIEIAVLMFDGCLLYGNHYDNTGLLQEITDYVNSQMPNLNMSWAYKPHDMALFVPDNFDESKILDNKSPDTEFIEYAKEFEVTHCKIIEKGCYLKQRADDVLIMSSKQLKDAYSHIQTGITSKGGAVNFISKWMINNNNIKCFDNMDIFPDPTKCPANYYNLWIPFSAEKELEGYEYNESCMKTQAILNHIKILCNNQASVYDYIVKYIAQMIQFPAVKSIVPTFISKQGAGKGTLLKLFSRMLGKNKVYETTTPSRDVWGNFNAIMTDTFLVNLNELSKKETKDAEGQIKQLATDGELTINQKGINQYKIKSYHHFIITTNTEDPITTTKDDRRNVIIRCSDELIGNKAYFNKLNEYLDDDFIIKNMYDYFKRIPDMDTFGSLPIPETDYQNNLKEANRHIIDLWLEAFTICYNKEKAVLKFNHELFADFNMWKQANNMTYEISNVKFGCKLSNLNIPGIVRDGLHKRNFNIDILKSHYKIL